MEIENDERETSLEPEYDEIEIEMENEPYLGGSGPTYTEGFGIDISSENEISVDTNEIQEKLIAGENISIVDNVITASATESVTVLTADDYNFPTTGEKDGIALWLLNEGQYIISSNTAYYEYDRVKETDNTKTSVLVIRKAEGEGAGRGCFIIATNGTQPTTRVRFGITNEGYNSVVLPLTVNVIDSLTDSSTVDALSANQGKELKDLIDGLIIKGNGAPTTSTEGTVGMIYEDITNGDLYQLKSISSNIYTWEKISGGVTYTAGTNISISDENVISATDTTYSNFIGTDGNTGGTAGLVPAPTTADVDKFLKSDGTWQTAGGGGGPTVVQTTGNSTTDVMSQNATTGMIYKDVNTKYQIQISGGSSDVTGIGSVAIGYGAQAFGQQAISIASGVANGARAISIGGHANNGLGAKAQGSIALGYGAATTKVGEMNIGTTDTSYGYNSTKFRLLSGVHDGEGANDAVTVGQINSLIDAINTATGSNISHIGA